MSQYFYGTVSRKIVAGLKTANFAKLIFVIGPLTIIFTKFVFLMIRFEGTEGKIIMK